MKRPDLAGIKVADPEVYKYVELLESLVYDNGRQVFNELEYLRANARSCARCEFKANNRYEATLKEARAHGDLYAN